jgi:UDP-glucose 4-epimerase
MLITGGHGFIGTNLCTKLASEGKNFRVLDIAMARHPWSYDALYADVTACLPPVSGRTIVHLAAETNVRRSLAHPRRVLVRNGVGLLNCLDLIRSENFQQLIFTSSASSHLASSPYLASKRAGEAYCDAYRTSYGIDVKVLKLSSVYGPYSMHKNSVIHSFIKQCMNGGMLTIFGDGSQKRDFIFVDDVVSAIIEQRDGYVCTGRLTEVKYIANMVTSMSKELLGHRPRIVYENFIEGEVKVPDVVCGIDKIEDIETGIYKTFQWFVRNYATQQLV